MRFPACRTAKNPLNNQVFSHYVMHCDTGGLSMNHAIILAGGTGSRTGLSFPKQFALIGGKPCIAMTISSFDTHPDIDSIILVCHPDHISVLNGIIAENNYSKIKGVFPGGKTRQESSWNGINAQVYSPDDIILIHDAARPFVSSDVIRRVISASLEYGAALPAIPPTDSLFTVSEGNMIGQIDRSTIFCAQTPQGFRFSIIKEAHESAIAGNRDTATDDAGLVMRSGLNPRVVEGSETNIKITTARDLIYAEAILRIK